jgi:hypothetical protein
MLPVAVAAAADTMAAAVEHQPKTMVRVGQPEAVEGLLTLAG